MARKWLLVGGVAIVALLAIPIAWYLISPLFINRTVNDDFPTVVAAAPTAVGTAIGAAQPAPTPTIAAPTATAPGTGAAQPGSAAAPAASQAPPAASAAPASSAGSGGPVALRSGQFHDVVHEGSGTATIYRLPDGKLVLRLENFDVLNGPDLYVYLSALPDSTDSPPVLANQFLSLGRLKGNKGNQTYDLPADFDPRAFNSVTIWCQQFRVNFATAPLK